MLRGENVVLLSKITKISNLYIILFFFSRIWGLLGQRIALSQPSIDVDATSCDHSHLDFHDHHGYNFHYFYLIGNFS